MRGWRADLAWTTLLALVVLGPLLSGPGFWLVGDMVFVPRQPWKGEWLGLDGSLPRAVPMDAVVSALTHVLPGTWVQRLLLVGPYLLGGVGAGRLVRTHRWYARAAAVTFFCWNPWVLERLEIGQWAILAGYFALPWVALAARRVRADVRPDIRQGWAPAYAAVTAAAVCSPSSGLMAALVLLVLGVRRRWWSVAVVLGTGLVANLPWLLPSVLATSTTISTDGVFAAFAARGESSLGVLPSLLSGGGTWKTSIVPDERTSAVVVALACLLTVAGLAGALVRPRAEVGRLGLLAGVGLALALLPAVPGGAGVLDAVGDAAPGLAVLRDSQRFLAPAVLLLLPGLAAAATWCRDQVRPGREAMWAFVGLLVAAPVVLLPSLAWGGLGDLQRSSYPADWDAVAHVLAAQDQPTGATIVLPWRSLYRGFDWTHGRAVLDPAPRFLPGRVLVDDRLFVDDLEIASEDPDVTAVGAALDAPDSAAALRALGVRWVLVEKGMPAGVVPAGTTAFDGPELRLVDLGPSTVGDAGGGIATRADYAPLVILGDVGVYVLFICSVGATVRSRSNGRHIFARRPARSLGGD